jgi:hypothetical protein
VLITCHSPDIDPNIFKAVGKNGLVHDGKLVVAGDFSTVDPFVFAAGTCAKFSRKLGLMRAGLGKEQITEHGVFDSKEVAEQLAKALLRRIDPIQAAEDQGVPVDYSSELGKRPKAIQAILPGGFLYFNAHAMKTSEGDPLTLNTSNPHRYTRLDFVGKTNVLFSFTCLWPMKESRKSSIHQSNTSSHAVETISLSRWLPSFVRLIGLPASYMNRIVDRHKSRGIADFIEFFQQPWATALYNESFLEFRLQLTQKLRSFLETSAPGQKSMTDADRLQAIVKKIVTNQHDGTVVSDSLPMDIKTGIQSHVLAYLEQNLALLPNYEIPKSSRPVLGSCAPE